MEVGVKKGNVFLKLRISKKIGVDPKFKIKRKRKLKTILKNLSNISNEYYKMNSDMFFQKHAYRLEDFQGVDVAFIDGLHTYEQSLKDVINCLKFLKEDGIIDIHDCSPLSEAQAYPANSRENAANFCQSDGIGDWSGDVWKTIVFLRSTRKNLNIFVLDCDHGLGIITRGKSESTLEFSKADIYQLFYKDLERNRLKILNLKTTDYLQEFLKQRKSSAI